MNYFDIIIIVPIIWGAIMGFKNGLIKSLSGFVALFLGIWGAIEFSDYISKSLIQFFEIGDTYLPIISFTITFIAIVIVIHILAKMLDKIVSVVALGFVNKILGLLFGVFKTILIVGVVVLILDRFNHTLNFMDASLVADSFLYIPLLNISNMIFSNINF